MTRLINDHQDSAVSPHFQLNHQANNIKKLTQISSKSFLKQEHNSDQHIGQISAFGRIRLQSDIDKKPLKYYSVRNIEQKSPKKSKNPCGNQKCRICKKVKSTPDRKYLEFLNRKKFKAPLPALPMIKAPKPKYQQQVHLLFESKNKSRLRKVNSVLDPSIEDYEYVGREEPRYSRIRAVGQRKYYTEQQEPIHKYIKINGKMYEIIEKDNDDAVYNRISSLSHVSNRRLKPVKDLVNQITEDSENWRVHKEQQQNQRSQLNKMVQKYIKFETMFHQLRNDGSTIQNKSKGPQKMTLYRLKDDQAYEVSENKDDFQSTYERQLTKNVIQQDQQQQTEVYSIKFPNITEIQSSISNYESLTGQFNVETLKKSKNYFREYSDETGKQFLYFGGWDSQKKQRKGFGVLVTKKNILEGIWMKNFIVKGAELKANSIYKGEFLNNKKHGEGTCKWLNGEQYMGQWANGLRNGQGYWSSKNNKETYSGEWRNGKVFGYGQYYKKDVSFYKGTFQNFVKNGVGSQQFTNGDKFEGKYMNGVPEGLGTYVWSCGLKYEGSFVKGEREGKGRLGMIGQFEIDGMFEKEKPHGICQLKLRNKDVFNGKYVYGEKYGYGKLQNGRTGISKQGFWNHGMLQQSVDSLKKEMYIWESKNQTTYQA